MFRRLDGLDATGKLFPECLRHLGHNLRTLVIVEDVLDERPLQRVTGGNPVASMPLQRSVPRISEPTGRIATPPPVRRADPGEELITVHLCADSLRQATRWCSAFP